MAYLWSERAELNCVAHGLEQKKILCVRSISISAKRRENYIYKTNPTISGQRKQPNTICVLVSSWHYSWAASHILHLFEWCACACIECDSFLKLSFFFLLLLCFVALANRNGKIVASIGQINVNSRADTLKTWFDFVFLLNIDNCNYWAQGAHQSRHKR